MVISVLSACYSCRYFYCITKSLNVNNGQISFQRSIDLYNRGSYCPLWRWVSHDLPDMCRIIGFDLLPTDPRRNSLIRWVRIFLTNLFKIFSHVISAHKFNQTLTKNKQTAKSYSRIESFQANNINSFDIGFFVVSY